MKDKNLFIDETRKIVQYHSKVGVAADGALFDGYIEHSLKTRRWHVLCLTYEDKDAWLENDADWGMCGSGDTLVEAVANMKKHAWYDTYPLMNMFK